MLRQREWVWGYRETDALGGPDPYSASKGAAEQIRSHVKSFFHKDSLSLRSGGTCGNVIGGGDWAADRIVPDCVRSWASGKSVELRNHATRPWQHVLNLSGYPLSQRDGNPELQGEPFGLAPCPTSSQRFGTGQTDVYSLGSGAVVRRFS